MECKLFKVGGEISHLSFYKITPEELSLIKKAVGRMVTRNDTLPKERDLVSRLYKDIRNCVIFEISEDSEDGII